jgi:hypothetical protein
MIRVETKQMSSKIWCCYATIDGYDYSYSSKTMEDAQLLMLSKLKSVGKRNYAIWAEPVIIPAKVKAEKVNRNVIGYAKSRIDNL